MNYSDAVLAIMQKELSGNPTAEELISDLQDARKEIACLKKRIEGLTLLCEKQKQKRRELEADLKEQTELFQGAMNTCQILMRNGFNGYQDRSAETAVYPGKGETLGLMYAALGLAGESGEVAEKVKKHLRDGTPKPVEALEKELGDVLWYVAAVARECGLPLSQIARGNLEKLKDRAERNVLNGSGDNR